MPTIKRALPSSPRLVYLQLHGAALLFGLSALLGKISAVSPAMIVAARGMFALIPLTVLILVGPGSFHQRSPANAILRLLAIGALLSWHWQTFFIAVRVGGVAVATLGFASFPAFVVLLERFLFGTRLRRRDLLTLLLVLTGLVLVTPSFQPNDDTTLGLLWGVASGALYGVIAIANARCVKEIDGLRACWWQCLAVVVVMMPFTGSEVLTVSANDWVILAGLGIFCTGIAYTLFIHGLRRLGAQQATLVIAMEPVYAIAATWLLFGSSPSLRMTAGGALIIAAVLWSGRRGDAVTAQPSLVDDPKRR